MELDSQAGGMVYISPIANGAPAFAAVCAPKFGHNEDCLRPKWTHVAQFLDSQYHQMDSHTSEKNGHSKKFHLPYFTEFFYFQIANVA